MKTNYVIDADAPALLLPGLLCDARIFEGLESHLPKLRMAADYGDCDSLEAMAARVLADAPRKVILIGHSMGARVALEAVRRAPDRVAALALVSTGTHPVAPGEADKRHALRDIGRAQGMAALVAAWLPPMVVPTRRGDAALMARLTQMCLDAGLDRFEAQINALLTRPEVESLLPAIRCPVLVACGDADTWSPPEQHRAIAAAIPGATLSIVAGAGHMLPAERPDALAGVLRDWIADIRPTSSKGESL